MRRFVRPMLLVCATIAPAFAAERPSAAFDSKIAELCRLHRVPERLVHRVIMRESRYAPRAVSRGNYGLMQIRLGTARSMGYRGGADGLLDGHTNLTYAVPYLANAYTVAGGDEDRAVHLYASGFYYAAKRQGALARLQTAQDQAAAASPVIAYAPVATTNPFAALFSTATQNAASAPLDMVARADDAVIADADDDAATPLPPRRPRAYSTRAFLRLAAQSTDDLRGASE